MPNKLFDYRGVNPEKELKDLDYELTRLYISINNVTNLGIAASSVVSETSSGQVPAVGTSNNYAREDHTHGTPGVAANPGWSVTPGYSTDKAFSPEKTSLTEVARVLGTLIDALKTAGILGS